MWYKIGPACEGESNRYKLTSLLHRENSETPPKLKNALQCEFFKVKVGASIHNLLPDLLLLE
jgi:hypothetical protein